MGRNVRLLMIDQNSLMSQRAKHECSSTNGDGQAKPLWKRKFRQLWAGHLRLHKFGRQAHNLVLVLNALQEADWPEWLANPFSGCDALERLVKAVYGLNGCQCLKLIQFHFHTTDAGEACVTWEWIDSSKEKTQK